MRILADREASTKNQTVSPTDEEAKDAVVDEIANDTSQAEQSDSSQYEIGPSDTQEVAFKLSPRRWVILASICSLGLIHSMCGDFSSILSVIVELLDIDLKEYIYASQMTILLLPLMAVPTAAYVDRFGIKTSAYTYLFVVTGRNCCHALLFSPSLAHWSTLRYFYWMSASIISIEAWYLLGCLPLKVSEHWFPKEERSLAWSLMVVFPSFGSSIANIWFPEIAPNAKKVHPIAYINLTSLLVSAVIIIFGITRSKPKYPPSSRRQVSSRVDTQSMAENWRKLVLNYQLMLHTIVGVTIGALMGVICTVMQDILLASGLSMVFAGNFMATMNTSSSLIQLGGSLVLGRMASRAKADNISTSMECKIYTSLQSIAFLVLATTLCLNDLGPVQGYLSLVTTLIFQAISSWSQPILTNMSVQLIAGSTSEPTITAASGIIYAVLSTIYTFGFVSLRQVNPATNRPDYSASMLFVATIITITSSIYICFFRFRPPNTKALLSRQDSAA